MRNLILAAIAGTLFAASAAPLEIVSPKEGATVPILTADMKTYLAQPRAEREKQFADPAERKRIAKFGDRPQKTLLSWNCTASVSTGAVWSVKVRRAKDSAVVFNAKTHKNSIEIDNLEIACDYKWRVKGVAADGGMAKDPRKSAFAQVLRVFLDEKNYPIDFHCIAGADRTGSLAFILNGLLGVDEEELWRDWEVTAFQKEKLDFGHRTRFSKLVKVFDAFPGANIHEKIVAYVKSAGFTDADIEKFRSIMLEP